MRIFTINSNDEGQRLDKFLGKLMPDMPKSRMYKGIRKNDVRINDKHCHDEKYILKLNDELKLYFPDEFYKSQKTIKKAGNIDVVYEDDNILIINKPVGIPVHADDKGTNDTLIDRVLYYLYEKGEYNPLNENSFTPALCNRLDRNTGGLVIAAKNAPSLRIINEKIRNREIRKIYLAKCEGIFEKKEDIVVSHLKREEKSVKLASDGKEIKTGYKVLKEADSVSLVEIELFTGRTHQIRVQMSELGHPLIGDVKYGGKKIKGGYSLTSYKLEFAFTTSGGSLDYLNNKKFSIKTE